MNQDQIIHPWLKRFTMLTSIFNLFKKARPFWLKAVKKRNEKTNSCNWLTDLKRWVVCYPTPRQGNIDRQVELVCTASLTHLPLLYKPKSLWRLGWSKNYRCFTLIQVDPSTIFHKKIWFEVFFDASFKPGTKRVGIRRYINLTSDASLRAWETVVKKIWNK